MTEIELNSKLKKIRLQLKDAAEALNPAYYRELQKEYDRLLAIKIPMWGTDGD